MGRYYSGDIEGKFWFGIQSSHDASFFGGEVFEPQVIEYGFSEDDLDSIKKGLSKCKKQLGSKKEWLDKFFKKHKSYNNEMLQKEWLEMNEEELDINEALEWYARLRLGQKIYDCVENLGQCYFDAEY